MRSVATEPPAKTPMEAKASLITGAALAIDGGWLVQ
jgi:hypothetical protein